MMSLTPPPETKAPLVPGARARRGAAGVPMTIGEHQWFLAWGTTAPTLDELRDRIFDSMMIRKSVAIPDVLQVAWVLLTANYNLDESEVAALITATEEKELVDSVLDALFGAEEIEHTYSSWVRASLYGAGLDPTKIPPADVPAILKWLVQTERAPAAGDVIPAARNANEDAKWKALLRSQGHLKATAPAIGPAPAGLDGGSAG